MIFKQKFLKKINGKNFYASKSKYPILNLTMIYNNPKSGNKNLCKLEILTPDTSKEEIITAFSTLGTVSSDTQAVPSSFMPFIVTPPGEQIFSLMIAGCSCSSKALELLNKERVRLRLSSFDKPS